MQRSTTTQQVGRYPIFTFFIACISILIITFYIYFIPTLSCDKLIFNVTGYETQKVIPVNIVSRHATKCPVGKRGMEVPVLNTNRPHIVVGVLLKNREPYTETFAQSLIDSFERHPEWKNNVHIRLYDDGSDKLSLDILIKKFPMVEKLTHYRHSLGWKGIAIIEVFHHDCIRTNYDICVFGDIDLVFHPDWVPNLVRNMNRTDGQLTLYNSCSHGMKECDNEMCEKKSFGSAGTALTRKLAEELSCNLPPAGPKNHAFDVNWSIYLRDTKRKIYTLNPSMTEHIGIYQPSNGVYSMNEQSRNFDVFSLKQPLSTLIYYHLISRNHSSCNFSKLNKPNGWSPDPAIDIANMDNKDYFILNKPK